MTSRPVIRFDVFLEICIIGGGSFILNDGAKTLMTTHSDKARETLRLMNTRPDQWGLVEILWRKERRQVPTEVRCPECFGTGRTTYAGAGAGELVSDQALSASCHYNPRKIEEAKALHNYKTRNCKRCPLVRKSARYGDQYIRGTGIIIAMVEREVMVGYPQFADGTRFDSRFQYSDGRSMTHCALCAKGINRSGRVPVTGRGDDGVIHGMWVGQDCARKFFGATLNFKTEGMKKTDHFIADNLAE